MSKPRFTHRGIVLNEKTGSRLPFSIRPTTHCWVTITGKRYLKSTGLPPGMVNKDKVLNRLLVDTVYEVFSNEQG